MPTKDMYIQTGKLRQQIGEHRHMVNDWLINVTNGQ